ncbi:MAG: cytochrome C oxidase subunit IV family protein [Myxococcota bacterium]
MASTAAAAHGHDDGGHHDVHVSSVQFNAVILGSLLFLTGLTYWTATLDLGFLDTPLALVIAFGKTSLVILYFMHVRWASSYVKILAMSGFVFLIFLFGFVLSDVATRTQEQPWGDYAWPGAAHRTGMIPDAPAHPTSVEHGTPGIEVGHGGESDHGEHGGASEADPDPAGH